MRQNHLSLKTNWPIKNIYLLFLCLQLLNLHMLNDWPMDRRETLRMRPRPLAPTAVEGEAGRLGQSPTSRHHSFRVTATPEALPIIPERTPEFLLLLWWRWWWWLPSWCTVFFCFLKIDRWIFRMVLRWFTSGRAVLTLLRHFFLLQTRFNQLMVELNKAGGVERQSLLWFSEGLLSFSNWSCSLS